MKCEKCGVSCFIKPLSRTKPFGQPDAGFMCHDCIKLHHPDIYDKLKDKGELETTNNIFNAINKNQS